MEYAPIVPIPMLHMIKDYRYHLVLAHLILANEDYAKFYEEQEGHLILDNGAYENGRPMMTDTYFQTAYRIGASEITAPDILGETYATVSMLRDFVERNSDGPRFNILVVLQCQNWTQFDFILNEAIHFNASSVALPKVMCKYLGPYARLDAAEKVRSVDSTIPIHCFGATDWMREAYHLANQGIVRGIDTAEPFIRAMNGESLWGVSKPRPHEFWSIHALVEAPYKERLNEYRQWCQTPSARAL